MLLAKSGGGQEKEYIDSLFSTYLYTGNGSTQTITNGIDLAGEGGLVWLKSRSDVATPRLYDTARGTSKVLQSSETTQQIDQSLNGVSSFNNNGFSLQSSGTGDNGLSVTYASWTFRKAPKFFDVLTYTGNGVADRIVAHNLGATPGMIISKSFNVTGSWYVYHRSIGTPGGLVLNLDIDSVATPLFGTTAPTATEFRVGSANNDNGVTYVAYLFAHDTSADGMIQCGSYTEPSSGYIDVNLGWEPQYILVKRADGAAGWFIFDTVRGWPDWNTQVPSGSGAKFLYANTSSAENDTGGFVAPTATGFRAGAFLGGTYIYAAIRRPNKPPTSGTEVYNAIARTGTGAAATVTGVGFAPDLSIILNRNKDVYTTSDVFDRLRGALGELSATNTNAEQSLAGSVISFDMDGISVGTDQHVNPSTKPMINWFFRRAPGFMDIVAYTGDGTTTVWPHSLGAAPELMILKSRSVVTDWFVYCSLVASPDDNNGKLNATVAFTYTGRINNPTRTTFTVPAIDSFHQSGRTSVAYLFATLAGISKVGSYTGNGSSQTINCGFSAGARFVLIKRTDSTGDWLCADTTRGIVAGNDPRLSLNTTAAEVTTEDWLDPDASGFIVNNVSSSNANVNGGTYVFLAVS